MKKTGQKEDKLTKNIEIKLIESTVKKRNEIIGLAKERAKQIIHTAELKCKDIRTQFQKSLLNENDIEDQTLRDKILRSTELEGRKIIMSAREDVVTKVFKNVEERLHEITERRDDDFNFDKILINLAIEAILAIEGKDFTLATNKREIDFFKKNQNKIVNQVQRTLGEVCLKIADKPVETMGGVIVQNKDGTKIYHNTLEGRLITVRNRSEAVVAKIIGML